MKKKQNHAKRRRFTAELKKLAVMRMKGGESVTALAREYQIERSRLYDWRDRWDSGRPFSESGRLAKTARDGRAARSELQATQLHVADLERKVGQQTLLIDFLRGALRQVNPSPATNHVSGATASSTTCEE
jgi:transposase-like protein